MSNTILIKKSGTPNAVPLAVDLAYGELAINYADGNLFYKNSAGGGTVTVIASNKFLSVSGNVTAANITASGIVNFASTSNIDLGSNANIHISGGIAGQQLATDGNGNLYWTDGGSLSNGTSNISIYQNGNISMSVGGTSNVAVFTTQGISLAGNVIAGNVLTDNLLYANGQPWDLQQPAGSNNQIQYNDNGSFGANANLSFNPATGLFSTANISATGTVTATGNATFGNISTAGSGGNITGANVIASTSMSATANITGGNLVTGGQVSATGNITGGNISTAGNIAAAYFIGNGSQLSGVTASSMDANNLTGTTLASSVVNSSLTSVGTLSSLSVSGSVTGGNLYTGGNVSATGNVTAGNVSVPSGNIDVVNFVNVGALIATGRVDAGTTMSAAGNITGANLITSGLITSTGNVTGGNVLTGGTVSATANVTGGNLTTSGQVSATGNVTGGNVLFGTGIVSGTGNIYGGNIISGNAVIGNIDVSGDITVNSLKSNTTVSASGTVTGGNLLTGGNVSATANVTGGNILTGGLISATGNATAGNLITGGQVIATANVTGGNVTTAGQVSATANVIGGNVLTGGEVSATGNVTGGNINTNNLVGTGLTITSTGDLNLEPTGNVVLTNNYINGLATPVQDADAATKSYVDNMVSTGLAFHQPVAVATTGTLATATGGTITYAQPNGAANGVGATITTTGSFTVIDDANVQTVGTRILVKNEGNAVLNGVYTYANSTTIVRSTDADTYGPDSTTDLSLNDYFFVQSGNVNLGSSYVVNAPAGTITFGTSQITFAEFSHTQVYLANTQAGLSLVGQTFNAKVDNISTSFDGSGNIVVKPSAQLTTPNIGAATGTSLSVTGNIDVGNVNAALLSATGNVIGGNINTGGNVSATGNIAGSYFIGNGSQLTGVTASSSQFPINAGTSNMRATIDGNITVSINGSGNLYTFTDSAFVTTQAITATGSVVSGNVLTGGNVSATGNVTGGNVLTAGYVSATGNATAGNLITGGLVNATGNITGGNLFTTGLANIATLTVTTFANITATTAATSNITGALRVAGGVGVTGNVYADGMYVGGDSVLTTTSTVDGGTF